LATTGEPICLPDLTNQTNEFNIVRESRLH
jgi:hypothetical protein